MIKIVGLLFVSLMLPQQDRQTKKQAPKAIPVKLTRVLDGDTIQVKLPDERVTTIRLSGIDAPELPQVLGKEAASQLKKKLSRKTITLNVTGQDRYGRNLADVFANGSNVNLDLVKNGLAWHYAEKNKDLALMNAQAEAKKKKLGIWKSDKRIAPWDYRNGVRTPSKEPANAPSIRTKDTGMIVGAFHTSRPLHSPLG